MQAYFKDQTPGLAGPWRLVVLAVMLAFALKAAGAAYEDNKTLAKHLKDLGGDHKKILRVERVLETSGKNDLWRIELGAGSEEERRQRPAMLVVAGIEGNDLAGPASVVAWAESLVQSYPTEERIRKLLDSTTIHVWPRLNPDAARHFFSKPRLETSRTARPTDDDHDGLLDEDGPDDLDGDGLITWMRVPDPDGEDIADPSEARLSLKADRIKGERGQWRYLVEGRDSDGDKAWNEDGVGGVNLNRNFPFGFRFFASDAGQHQVSELETRALADFVIAHPNIAVVFTFGAADNLIQTPKGEAPKRPPVLLHEEDLPWYRELGKTWRETLGLKKELIGVSEPGTFSDWMYFHRGRLSLAARPWSSALAVELEKGRSKENPAKPKEEKATDDAEKPAKESEATEEKAPTKAKEADKRNEEERAFLKWVDQNAAESFVPWKEFKHPDFPDKRVEIGGFAPFVQSNPPEKLLNDLVTKQGKFLTELAGKLPRIGVRKAEAKHLGESVYDVKIEVENSGALPTSLAQGSLTREVHPTRVLLKLDEKAILSGARMVMLNTLAGGGSKEVRWVIRAKGVRRLEVEVISMLGGRVQTTVDLPEGTN